MRFVRRTEPDHVMVSVRLSKTDAKARGEVFLPLEQRGETFTTASTPDRDVLSAAEALGLATTHALDYRTDVAVIDPDGLWRPEWGTLHDDREAAGEDGENAATARGEGRA